MRQLLMIFILLPLVLAFALTVAFSTNSKASDTAELTDKDFVKLYLETNPHAQRFQIANELTLKDLQVKDPTLTGIFVRNILGTSGIDKRVNIDMVDKDNTTLTYTCYLHILHNNNLVYNNVHLSSCGGPDNAKDLSTPSQETSYQE